MADLPERRPRAPVAGGRPRALLPQSNRKVPEGYIAFVEEFPGANTQGATLEEARTNLKETVTLVVEANRMFALENAPEADLIGEPLKVTALSDAISFGTWNNTGRSSCAKEGATRISRGRSASTWTCHVRTRNGPRGIAPGFADPPVGLSASRSV